MFQIFINCIFFHFVLWLRRLVQDVSSNFPEVRQLNHINKLQQHHPNHDLQKEEQRHKTNICDKATVTSWPQLHWLHNGLMNCCHSLETRFMH